MKKFIILVCGLIGVAALLQIGEGKAAKDNVPSELKGLAVATFAAAVSGVWNRTSRRYRV